MRKFYYSIFLCLVITSCLEQREVKNDSILTGTWDLFQFTGGIGGGILTSQEWKHTKTFEFLDNETVKSYMDGKFKGSQKYFLTIRINSDNQMEVWIRFRKWQSSSRLKMKGQDIFVLENPCDDCQNEYYKRTK